MPKGRVLVVDDEEDTLQAVGFCLSQEGFTVLEARDGEEALIAVREKRPEVLVLDVMLPRLNGYEVSRRIKERTVGPGDGPTPKVLLLTARRVDSLEREEFVATWSQADLVMYKPFEMDELLRQVTRLMALGRQSTEEVASKSGGGSDDGGRDA